LACFVITSVEENPHVHVARVDFVFLIYRGRRSRPSRLLLRVGFRNSSEKDQEECRFVHIIHSKIIVAEGITKSKIIAMLFFKTVTNPNVSEDCEESVSTVSLPR